MDEVSGSNVRKNGVSSDLLITLLIIIVIIAVLVAVLVKIFLIQLFVKVISQAFVLTGFASEPIDGSRDELLFDFFTKLIIKFQTLFNIGTLFIVLIEICRRFGGVEEVEKAVGWDGPLDDAGLLCVCDSH